MSKVPEAKRNVSVARWRKKHPDKVRATQLSIGCRYSRARSQAKTRGLEFSISIEEHALFITRPCFYCGWGLPLLGSGLDRIDNTKGYVEGNILPCCSECNIVRGDRFNMKEMQQIGAVICRVKCDRLLDGLKQKQNK